MKRDKRNLGGAVERKPVLAVPEDRWRVVPLPPGAVSPAAGLMAQDPEGYQELDYLAHCCAAFRYFEARHGRRPQLGPELESWVEANLEALRSLVPDDRDYDRAREALEARRQCEAAERAYKAEYGHSPRGLGDLLTWENLPPEVAKLASKAFLEQAKVQGEA